VPLELLLPGEEEPCEELLPGVVLVPLEEVPGLPMLLPPGRLVPSPAPEEPELMPDWEPLMPGEPTALLLEPLWPCCCCCCCMATMRVKD
jgi:hypothetical protein